MKFEQIRILRENKNLKQREIAKALNVERSTYAGWETGRDPIPLRKLNDLSKKWLYLHSHFLLITLQNQIRAFRH